jgi:hypothetical protein
MYECRILVGNPEGKRPLGRTKSRYELDLREIEWVCSDWIVLAQDRDYRELLRAR